MIVAAAVVVVLTRVLVMVAANNDYNYYFDLYYLNFVDLNYYLYCHCYRFHLNINHY